MTFVVQYILSGPNRTPQCSASSPCKRARPCYFSKSTSILSRSNLIIMVILITINIIVIIIIGEALLLFEEYLDLVQVQTPYIIGWTHLTQNVCSQKKKKIVPTSSPPPRTISTTTTITTTITTTTTNIIIIITIPGAVAILLLRP